jgi:hypothetical protein
MAVKVAVVGRPVVVVVVKVVGHPPPGLRSSLNKAALARPNSHSKVDSVRLHSRVDSVRLHSRVDSALLRNRADLVPRRHKVDLVLRSHNSRVDLALRSLDLGRLRSKADLVHRNKVDLVLRKAAWSRWVAATAAWAAA